MEVVQFIRNRTGLAERSIKNTLNMFSQGATIPFLARYRKETTGNLDEVQLGQILNYSQEHQEVVLRRDFVLKKLRTQSVLNEELEKRLQSASNLNEIEDIYLPFKKKKSSRAEKARAAGLEPLGHMIWLGLEPKVEKQAENYISEEFPDIEEALQGARDIVAERINEEEKVRKSLRRLFRQTAVITVQLVKSKEQQAQAFKNYFEMKEHLAKVPSHRLLAVLRAQREGYFRIKIEVEEKAVDRLLQSVFPQNMRNKNFKLAADDAFNRLLKPSLSKEVLSEQKERADVEAIEVFAKNLQQLLMAAPLGTKRILALDPGFKSGCKLVCLDEQGDLLYNETIYPHPPQKQHIIAGKKLKSLLNAYQIEAIAIGNGTASRETELFVKKAGLPKNMKVFIVNEAGASVYSASEIARKEFPDYDVTVRGAVSIGRRLADPLAELVKVDPKAIGVGQYQHDVNQTKLKKELDQVVELCVNRVGVDLNTASSTLLSYISGIGSNLADNIVQYRKEKGAFRNRRQLLEVPRLGEKAFEMAAGFLRVPSSDQVLDNTTVHPESYGLVEQMARDLHLSVEELISNEQAIRAITPEEYTGEGSGLLTVKDILKELVKPGVDPRQEAKVFEFAAEITKFEDLKLGMKLPGIINNITNFGCFVNIGIKESGLVHISKLSKQFIRDVNEVVSLQQQVEVRVLEIDHERKRIQLSMID